MNLKIHFLKFTDRLPCDVCGKLFSTKEMLNHHVKTVHVDNNEICEVCGKNFKHKRNLREHFRKQHKVKDPSKVQRGIK